MKFKRFGKKEFLEQVGRPLLDQVFKKFSGEVAAKGITLPAAELDDAAYYSALARLVRGLDGLPNALIEALFEIEEMATPEGEERLRRGVAEAGLSLVFDARSTRGDIAARVWLAAPELLAAKHSEVRLHRLAIFEYFGSKTAEDRRGSFAAPDAATLERIKADLDAWFAAHNRSKGGVHIEVYVMQGEYWFVVGHGDTFARKPKLENGRREVLHYWPAKDDVVVFSPWRDEVRIHAATKGERELYRTTFGRRLFGDDQCFSVRRRFTLEPLRLNGADALDVTGIEGMDRIALIKVKVRWGGEYNRCTTWEADDLVAAAADAKFASAIPAGGTIEKAVLMVWFTGSATPRRVEVRPPGVLRLGRHCDAATVQLWLSAREFRVPIKPSCDNASDFALAGA